MPKQAPKTPTPRPMPVVRRSDGYYFGSLAGLYSSKFCKNAGNFMLMEGPQGLQLCVSGEEEEMRKFTISTTEEGGGYRVGSVDGSTLHDLVVTLRKDPTMGMRQPFLRPSWCYSPEYVVVDSDGSELGAGAFGTVLGATWISNGQRVAVKVAKVKKAEEKPDLVKAAFLEAKTMSAIPTHSNILGLIGLLVTAEVPKIVVPYCPVSVQFLLKNENVAEHERLRFCTDVMRGLSHLHANKVLHRDIAARNLLMDRRGNVKLCDFGLATCGSLRFTETHMKVPTRWAAPELLTQGMVSSKSDVFSATITAWELSQKCTEVPYAWLKTRSEVREYITAVEFQFPMLPPIGSLPVWSRIFTEGGATDPSRRSTAKELLILLSPHED